MGGDEDVRSWSHAPNDILALISSKLCAGDASAFYAVCKTWSRVDPQAVVERGVSGDELYTCPCLIFPNKRFFHPLYNTWFHVESTHELPTGVIAAQNYGWLLMKRYLHPSFFFNPFTGDRIDLPIELGLRCRISNFSTPPTSHDCEIFSFFRPGEHIVVQTIKRGEDEISSKDICRCDEFFFMIGYKTVFFKGEYYCLGSEGDLVIYNPKVYKYRRKKNKYRRTDSAIHMWEHFYAPDCGQYLFEGEGDLWAVFIAWEGKEVCVCKLNLNRMAWERVHDLGDRMVFLSYESCLMVRAKVRGAGNKIYFPKLMRGYCLFYSLATKKYHTFEKGGSSYNSLHNSKDMMRCTWIQMNTCPSSQSCMQVLPW